MNTVIPAILPHSVEELKETLATVSFAKQVQIDLVDGVFVSPPSWPFEPRGDVLSVAELLSPFEVEIDLMVEDSVAVATKWHDIGVRRFIFHIENTNTEDIRLFKKEEVTIGCAIQNDTPLETLIPYLEVADYVQLMGIKTIGSQGQPFDERVLLRAQQLHTEYPTVPLAVDGGVSDETLPHLKAAGITRFIVGSKIIRAENPEIAFTRLSSEH